MEGGVAHDFFEPMSSFALVSTDYLSMRLRRDIFGKITCAGEDAANSAAKNYG
jgi:hypothetical protein